MLLGHSSCTWDGQDALGINMFSQSCSELLELQHSTSWVFSAAPQGLLSPEISSFQLESVTEDTPPTGGNTFSLLALNWNIQKYWKPPARGEKTQNLHVLPPQPPPPLLFPFPCCISTSQRNITDTLSTHLEYIHEVFFFLPRNSETKAAFLHHRKTGGQYKNTSQK